MQEGSNLDDNRKSEYANYRKLKGWATLFRPTEQERQLFNYEFRRMPIGPGVLVVDVGFGNGAFLQWAADRKASIAGMEIQEELLAEAATRGIKTYGSLKEIGTAAVNLVTFMDVLEHLEWSEIADCLVEVKRLLRSDGYLIARFPNCQSPAGLVEQFGDRTHKTMLSGPIFTSFLDMHGFKVLEVREAKCTEDFGVGFLDTIVANLKGTMRIAAKALYRIGFGTGMTPLSPSVIVVAALRPVRCTPKP